MAKTSDCDLISSRLAWIKKWSSRSCHPELRAIEANLKSSMPAHLSRILSPKRIQLWKEMLIDLEYDDVAVVNEVARGVDILGEVELTGVYRESFRPASCTISQMREVSSALFRKVLKRTKSSGCLTLRSTTRPSPRSPKAGLKVVCLLTVCSQAA